MLVTERTETMRLMDELEAIVMRDGWPVPFSGGYYLVQHERLLNVVDRLRGSLQDELDERFLQAFGQAFDDEGDVGSTPDEQQETILIANGKGTQA